MSPFWDRTCCLTSSRSLEAAWMGCWAATGISTPCQAISCEWWLGTSCCPLRLLDSSWASTAASPCGLRPNMVIMRMTHLAPESIDELEMSVTLHSLTKFEIILMAVGVSKESQSASCRSAFALSRDSNPRSSSRMLSSVVARSSDGLPMSRAWRKKLFSLDSHAAAVLRMFSVNSILSCQAPSRKQIRSEREFHSGR